VDSAEKRQQTRLVEHLDEMHSYCYKAHRVNQRHKWRHNDSQTHKASGYQQDMASKKIASPWTTLSHLGKVGCSEVNVYQWMDTPQTFNSENSGLDELHNPYLEETTKVSFESFNSAKNQKRKGPVSRKHKTASNCSSSNQSPGRPEGHRYRRLQHNVLERNRRYGLRTQFHSLQSLLYEYDKRVKRAQQTSDSSSSRTDSSSSRMARGQMLDRASEVVRELEYSTRQLRETLSQLCVSNRSLKMRLVV